MNENEPSARVETRIKRITDVSRIFRILIAVGFILGGYMSLAFYFGWPAFFIHDNVRVTASHSHVYQSVREMPLAIQIFCIVRSILGFFCMAILFLLFRLYGQGILFSRKNVRYIRFLGYYLAIDWILNYEMQSTLKDVDLSMTPLLVGFLVIFVAWIMDEGRKIQEEQALTV